MNIRASKRFYEFDSFRIDVDERRLLRSDEYVPLMPKDFDVLLALVEKNGHTLTKEELMDRIWAETFVEDGNLYRHISTLRKVLGEDPVFIKTVPKRGYRFEGDVREIVGTEEESFAEKASVRRVITARPVLISTTAILVILILGAVWVNRGPANLNASMSAMAASRGTSNQAAFELYQSGRTRWQNRSVEGLHQATVDLEHAILKDPDFALAHAALADAYAFDVNLWKKAEPTANEAMRLNPSLGQPYATVGFVRTFWEWKLPEAEPYFKQALALSPDHATAHQWYSINLILRRRGGASLAEMNRALEIEPDSLAINADLCQILYFSNKFDEAIDQCRKTVEMDPKFINAHTYLYDAYTARGMHAEAVAEYFRTEELSMTTPVYPDHLDELRSAYAAGGIRSFWQTRLAWLEKRSPPNAYGIAKYKMRLGQPHEAILWLERAVKAREFDAIFFLADPVFRPLGSDPRYKALATTLLNEPSNDVSETSEGSSEKNI